MLEEEYSMTHKVIMYGNRFYYLYDTYSTWQQAASAGKSHKRRNPRLHWYILKAEVGTVFPSFKYHLYMDRVRRIGL